MNGSLLHARARQLPKKLARREHIADELSRTNILLAARWQKQPPVESWYQQ